MTHIIGIYFFQVNDALEEVEDQRQSIAQWKRKAQKIQGLEFCVLFSIQLYYKLFFGYSGEMHDCKLLLEEQTSRNGLLEKRQRKFDVELGLLQVFFKNSNNI